MRRHFILNRTLFVQTVCFIKSVRFTFKRWLYLIRNWVIVWGGESACTNSFAGPMDTLLLILLKYWRRSRQSYLCYSVYSHISSTTWHLCLFPTPQRLRGSLPYLKSILDQIPPIAWLIWSGEKMVLKILIWKTW